MYQAGTSWLPVTPLSGQPQLLPACATGFYSNVKVALPPVPAGDTLRLRFETYFCQPVCEKEEVGVTGLYFYQSACPNTPGQNGYILFQPDTLATELTAGIYFDIGDCIADQSVPTFNYWVKSKRRPHGRRRQPG